MLATLSRQQTTLFTFVFPAAFCAQYLTFEMDVNEFRNRGKEIINLMADYYENINTYPRKFGFDAQTRHTFRTYCSIGLVLLSPYFQLLYNSSRQGRTRISCQAAPYRSSTHMSRCHCRFMITMKIE